MNTPRAKLLSVIGPDFQITRGSPDPLGASLRRGGINFAVFSKHATTVSLILFMPGEHEPIVELPFSSKFNRTGHVWHAFVKGLDPGIHYGYRLDRMPNENCSIHRFDRHRVLLDPFAKAISGAETWGFANERVELGHDQSGKFRRSLVVDDGFDWGMDQPLNIPMADSIIYELHVRGFTEHPSAAVHAPGTFIGLTEKLPYLKSLGVTTVELLPVIEFEEADSARTNPLTGERLLNFWGYHPINFFSPKTSYASSKEAGGQVKEFKEMVKRFHEEGIEVIVDVVFNHTAEGNEQGPTLSFRGIDNATYYMLNSETGKCHNYSGCGNTLNCNHPVVRQMIMECLHYWVMEMQKVS